MMTTRQLFYILLSVSLMFLSHPLWSKTGDGVKDANDLYIKAHQAYLNKQYDQAIGLLNDAYLLVDQQEAEQALNMKKAIEDLLPQVYYSKYERQIQNKQYLQALTSLSGAYSAAEKYQSAAIKDSVAAARALVYSYWLDQMSDEKIDATIKQLETTIKADPQNNAAAYLILGAAYTRKNNLPKAESLLLKCLDVGAAKNDQLSIINAKEALMKINVAKSSQAEKSKNWTDVYTYANKALSYGKDLSGYFLKGLSAIELNKWNESIDAWYQVAQLSDTYKPKAYYSIALSYQNLNNAPKACEYYQKLLEDPKYKGIAQYNMQAVLKCQ